MKNILIFSRTLLIGGAEKQAILLTKLLKDSYTTHLVVLHKLIDQKHQDLIEEYGIEVTYLEGNLLQKILRLIGILRQAKIDVIFSYLASNNLIATIAGKYLRVPFIIGGLRNSVFPQSFKLALLKILHNHFNYSTIINNYAGKMSLTKKGFTESKFAVIQNAVEVDNEPIVKKQNDTVTILSAARFVSQKDYLTAIQAISELVKNCFQNRGGEFRYEIIGYGELESNIRTWVRDLGIEQIANITIKPRDVRPYYKKADIFLSTSLFEGLSNSIIEAMSYSLPIVATNVGDNPYLVMDGENGFLCEVGNFQQIAQKLAFLSSHYHKRIEMGMKSHRFVHENFSMQKYREKYINFIENLS